jgi:thioredoxin
MKSYFPLIALFLLSSCSNYAQTGGEATAENFENAIAKGGVQLLDVRTAGEFRSGHIKGALQADWTDAEQFKDRTQYLDKSKPVYVYCLSGGRSAQAAKMLQEQGFTEVVNLQGGINAWKKEGRPLQRPEAGKPETGADQYQSLVSSAPVVLVDYGAEWCPPCRKMEPVIAAFMKENENKVRLIKMDGGVETQLMKQHGVDALPTFIVYKNGKETARKQGIMTKEEMAALVK